MRYSAARIRHRLKRVLVVFIAFQGFNILTIYLRLADSVPASTATRIDQFAIWYTTLTLVTLLAAKMRLLIREEYITIKVLIGVLSGYINLVIVLTAILLCAWVADKGVFLNAYTNMPSYIAGMPEHTVSQAAYMLGGSLDVIRGNQESIISPKSYRGGVLGNTMYMSTNFYNIMVMSKIGRRTR
jgi:hypothetical protein